MYMYTYNFCFCIAEKFFLERAHLLHSMEFSHDMLKISIDSEFNPRSSKEVFHQNGSVTLKVLRVNIFVMTSLFSLQLDNLNELK